MLRTKTRTKKEGKREKRGKKRESVVKPQEIQKERAVGRRREKLPVKGPAEVKLPVLLGKGQVTAMRWQISGIKSQSMPIRQGKRTFHE